MLKTRWQIRRLSLVKNTTTLEFTNGVLASAKYDNPSVLTNAFQIPVDMLKAIVSIPSALFQFTLKRDTEPAELEAEKKVIELQTALLKAELELLRKQEELDEARQ